MIEFDGAPVERKFSIYQYGYEDLGDDPSSHRWRASWSRAYDGRSVYGVALIAHPVLKVNARSVWVSMDSIRRGGSWEPFEPKWMRKRLCYNDAGAAWAKPTRDEAIRSLGIRLTRWCARLNNEMALAENAAHALVELWPDLAYLSDSAVSHLKGTAK